MVTVQVRPVNPVMSTDEELHHCELGKVALGMFRIDGEASADAWFEKTGSGGGRVRMTSGGGWLDVAGPAAG